MCLHPASIADTTQQGFTADTADVHMHKQRLRPVRFCVAPTRTYSLRQLQRDNHLTIQTFAGATKYANQILPLLLEGCRSPEASIRQSALYGLGAAAQKRPALFQAVASDALSRISAVITAPNSR